MKTVAVLAVVAACAMAQSPKRPKITGVAHIALYTHDIEQARPFYKDFLGYGEPFDLTNPDGSLSLMFIKVNDRQYLEISPEKSPNTDRLNHISIEVDDVDEVYERAVAAGAEIVYPLTDDDWGLRRFFVRDPNGATINVTQHAE